MSENGINFETQALGQNSVATARKQGRAINFAKIFKDIRKHKKLYYKVLAVVFVLATVYALSLPNYYVCTVKLSPELSSTRSTNSLLSLASSFGVNLGNATGGMGTEALFPTLYPELINSTDFKASLFQVPVTIEGDKKKGEKNRTMPYCEYLAKEQKSPWWSKAIKGLFSMFGSSKGRLQVENIQNVNPFRLTKKQAQIAKAIEKNVDCKVDKKTMVITIKVIDQDPVICATMADSVKTRLQDFITDYRTSKVRSDLTYNKKIFDEAKARYEKARDNYTRYSDTHRELSSQTALTKQSDLLNEMQIQQQLFQQVIAHVQQAEMKVQQETPAFTTLQSATVPVKKAGPQRVQIYINFLFLAFLCTTIKVLYKEGDLKYLFGLS